MSAATVLAALLPSVPFGLALVGLLLPQRSRAGAAALGIGGAAVALAAAIGLVVALDGRGAEAGTGWVDFGGLAVTLTLRLDPAAALVAVAVAAVALAVQVYSVGYLHDDDRYAPYAAQISLFTAAMLLVVVAGDLIMLLVGWEVMGICSYLLIGHDRRLPEAPAAAVKAFLVTRVGDVGFLLGIVILGVQAGSFRISDVLAHDFSPGTLTAACLLLLAGVAGKSAQFPLHTWLPDAMAGPTPISALIHAATMVAAGIYVLTRLFPLFEQAPAALAVLGVLAAVTLLLGALAATAQDDIKRVLAWSTVSQLGYMAGALAVGSPPAALFHLLSHAAFKALLFLAAGAVIHAVGSNLMSAMGGLRRPMPVTFWCTTVGLAALAGVPPLAGFWSKDGILVVAERAARHHAGPTAAWVGWLVWLAGLAGVALTAWYATRLLLRTFLGTSRAQTHPVDTPAAHAGPASPAAHAGPASPDLSPAERGASAIDAPAGSPAHTPAGPPHDPPGLLRWPVILLAVPSALLGLAVFVTPFRDALALDEAHLGSFVIIPVALLVAGAALAWWRWRADPAADPATALGPLRPAFARAFWLDEAQHALVVRPVRALGRLARRADEGLVDGAVERTGRGTGGLGGGLESLHRAGVPRAVVAVLGGALLLGLAAVLALGGVA
ncbi:NADH-quinone oxidoreductase subunit L [Micromonospora sp. WMMD1102]|uniref:NADH-quinone oxidoreductase subunit 5 family protein n=1 Tax=Micromonospora sp. WMMD1102 TaxID=3016105 RepID=UPI0024150AB3|nr:NADH-quinone oxidoreductase subunit L [Micromonospora sp. WMMD1102]MDG4790035.1 NADH-quinone oxidoreductase subunit L [Micromonospora sp. WMMD1102]